MTSEGDSIGVAGADTGMVRVRERRFGLDRFIHNRGAREGGEAVCREGGI